MKTCHSTNSPVCPSQIPRRGFLSKTLAIVIGGVLTLFPFAIGLLPFLDPLKKKKQHVPSGETSSTDADGFIRVTSVDSLKDPNSPTFFKIRADHIDAWNYFANTPVGSIYLYRTGEIEKDGAKAIVAFNTTCPHLGCAVDFKASQKLFACPCHNSSFSLDGKRTQGSVSKRDLDELDLKIEDKAIWVKYQEFHPGTAEKVEKT